MDTVGPLRLRAGVLDEYRDVLTPATLETIVALAPFDARRRELMQARIERRARRRRDHERIGFLPDDAIIGGTTITVRDARAGHFDGSTIPDDLQRQWIQGTGPGGQAATRRSSRASATSPTRCCPAPTAGCSTARTRSARSSTMSLDNQRNLQAGDRSAIRVFLTAAEQVAGEMNALGARLPRPPDHRRLAHAARLHDAHLPRARPAPRRSPRPRTRRRAASRRRSSTSRSTSCNNHARAARRRARRIVLYLPKIQTAEEAALWNDILDALETHLGLPHGHDQGLRARRAARGVRSS